MEFSIRVTTKTEEQETLASLIAALDALSAAGYTVEEVKGFRRTASELKRSAGVH